MSTQTLNEQDDTQSVSNLAENGKRVLVLGIGRCGLRVLNNLPGNGTAPWLDTLAIDTDSAMLDASRANHKINASADWSSKTSVGCGGDILRGERAIYHERHNIMSILQGHDLLIVTGGLGGGTGTGGIRALGSIAKSSGVPSIYVVTQPFSFESYSRRKNADDCVNELLPLADVMITLPADLLFSTMLSANAAVSEAYDAASQEIAGIVSGIAAVLRGNEIIGTNVATFMSALKERKAICGVGIGRATSHDGLDRCALALRRMLESPFMGGKESMDRTDAVILTVIGGNDLTIAELKRTLELASGLFPKNIELTVGASTSETMNGVIQISAVIIKYAPEDAPKKAIRKSVIPSEPVLPISAMPQSSFRDGPLESPELQLQIFDRGVFDAHPSVRFHDLDLDVPTYQRRNIKIDKGN